MKDLSQIISENLESSTRTDSINLDVCEKVTRKLFKYLGIEYPTWTLYAHSPVMANKMLSHLEYDTGTLTANMFMHGDHPSEFMRFPNKVQKIKPYTVGAYTAGNLELYREYIFDLVNSEKMDQEFHDIVRDFYENTSIIFIEFNTIIFCDRPLYMSIENGMVHSDNSAAIEYQDGFKIYSIDGYLLNEDIVMNPQNITLSDIKSEPNSEIRRIMIEKYGVSRFMIEMDTKLLDADYSGLPGSSLRTLMQDAFGDKWLIGSDGSTGRVYHMPVPIQSTSCRDAHNRICGFDESRIISES
jgi:hypothetical protein